MAAAKKSRGKSPHIAENRRARRDYEVSDTFEAGVSLLGTEVKSLRAGRADIAHAFIVIRDAEAFLMNADIPVYDAGNQFNHEPARMRKLLLHRRELNKLQASVQREGMTLVPLKIYFNNRGKVKVLIGLARGRKQADKREVERQRDWNRDKARLLRRG